MGYLGDEEDPRSSGDLEAGMAKSSGDRDIWLDRLEVFERLRTYIAMAEDERLYQPCEHMETNGISEIGKRINLET